MPLDDETSYRLLKLLSAKPDMSQRAIAREVGISLGKINFCLRAFMDRGWLKVNNFTKNRDKRVYAYYLTPQGAHEKARITVRFLGQKMDEYETIKGEIAELKHEAAQINSDHQTPVSIKTGRHEI